MGKDSVDVPNPADIIQQQAAANQINQFTPQGNLVFGSVDASGNFVPSTDHTAVQQQQTPFQQFAQGSQEDIFASMLGSAGLLSQNLPLAPINGTNLPQLQGGLDMNQIGSAPDPFMGLGSTVPGGATSPAQATMDGIRPQGAMGATGGGHNGMGQVTMLPGQPPGSPGSGAIGQDPNGIVNNIQQAVFDRGFNALNPVFQQQNDQFLQNLANKGVPLASEQGGLEFGNLSRAQNDALNNLALSSVGQGFQAQNQLFNQGLASQGQDFNQNLQLGQFANAAHAQGLQEQQALRASQIAEIQALSGGTPINPFPIQNFFSPSATDVNGAFQLAQNAQGMNQAGQTSALGGLFGLGSSIFGNIFG